VQYQMINLIRS